MERERRTVLLAAVSLLMYGLVSTLNEGPFAFFPANELVFFGIAVYFSFFNFRYAQVSYALMLSMGAIDLLNSQIFLSIFMDNSQLASFYYSPWLPYVRLGAYALMVVEITRFYVLTKWKVYAFTYPIVLLSIVAGVLTGVTRYNYLLQCIGLVLFVGMMHYAYKKNKEGIAVYSKSLFYLWYLLAFLKLTMLLTIYLYDLKFE